MKWRKFAACLLALCLLTAGCAGQPASPAEESLPEQNSSKQPVDAADPQTALQEIYEDIDIEGVSDADDEVMEGKFFFKLDELDTYYVRYANGRFGVADVFILKPEEGKEPSVRERLEQVKLSRQKEFENYDIYNSLQIAQEAEIFEQDGYIIMLMLADREAARQIIDHYIPR